MPFRLQDFSTSVFGSIALEVEKILRGMFSGVDTISDSVPSQAESLGSYAKQEMDEGALREFTVIHLDKMELLGKYKLGPDISAGALGMELSRVGQPGFYFFYDSNGLAIRAEHLIWDAFQVLCFRC